MKVVVQRSYGLGSKWYNKYSYKILDVTAVNRNYIVEKTDHNLAVLIDEEKKSLLSGEVLAIPKKYADPIPEDGPLILYKVLMNDGGWRSGDMPSEMIVARSKLEACAKCAEKRYISSGTSIAAHEFSIEGYDLIIKEK